MVWQYVPPTTEQAIVFGLAQRLDGGNTLITFGDTGRVREVDPDGGVVWNLNDTQLEIFPDGGPVPLHYADGGVQTFPDGGIHYSNRDWGIYRSWRIDTVMIELLGHTSRFGARSDLKAQERFARLRSAAQTIDRKRRPPPG